MKKLRKVVRNLAEYASKTEEEFSGRVFYPIGIRKHRFN